MLKLLLKKQLTEVFKGYFYNAKKNKKRSKVGVVLYFILFTVLDCIKHEKGERWFDRLKKKTG